jgi:phage terminase small subunit
VARKTGLTEKQAEFVRQYLIDLNATAAAIRAGYSPRTANEQASRLLANVSIGDAVAKAMAARSARTGIKAERVLRGLAAAAFGDPRKVVQWGPGYVTLVDSEGLSEEDAQTVQEVSVVKGKGLKVKFSDRLRACDLLLRHLGVAGDAEGGDDDGRLTDDERLAALTRLLDAGRTRAAGRDPTGLASAGGVDPTAP